MTKSRATAIGFIAVLLWSLLALLTVGTEPVPPLLLNALCFTIGAGLGFAGAATIIAGSGGFEAQYLPTCGLALLCALTWSGYSVLSRLMGGALIAAGAGSAS